MKEHVLILAFLLSSCTKASDSILPADPDVGENQAIISYGPDASQRYLMSEVAFPKFHDSCDENICLSWSDDSFQADFRLLAPQMSGTLLLSDPQVQLGYRLRGAVLRDVPPLRCPSCTGAVTLDADIGARTLHVAVDGILEMTDSCQNGWCGTWADADAFVTHWTPCDGGACLKNIPCDDGGLAGPAIPACPNTDYIAVPMTVKARATLEG